jgi:hypothetical protein
MIDFFYNYETQINLVALFTFLVTAHNADADDPTVAASVVAMLSFSLLLINTLINGALKGF